ncbi:MAG TPA: FecR domain-containing protein [Polyangiaceae bacterium]|jgi:TolA-binding protein|nr:FecR domain-containing protein [Polyangiaceae bacterium]
MTERKRRVEDVLEGMGRMVVPVADEPDAERDRIIEAVNLRLDSARRTARARLEKRWVVMAAAAMLCLSAGFAFAHYRDAQRAEATSAALDLFKRGDAIQTALNQTRTGSLEDGAQVKLAQNTEFTVSALTPGTDEIVLDRGRVDLTVPKLHSGHTLSVTTPDSTVTVRGTRFSVEVVIDGSRATTNVEVTQGSVWVRQGDARLVLEAGSHWSSRAPEPPMPAPAVAADRSVPPAAALEASAPVPSATPSAHPPETAVKTAAASGMGAPKAEATPPSAAESSTLAQENDLYAAASRAAREGNDALAVSTLSTLLSRYPSSPLVQNARVDRFRALSRSGRSAEAVAAARRYLADYPNGFARDEAKALVLQSLASP